jgi:regulator of sigma E protease
MPDVGDLLKTVLIVVQIVVGLGFLIFIHEAGHFLVAKWKGVRVEAFSLGMGPVLWKRTWGGTEYRISAIPLGGYVKMAGENIGDPKTGAPDELTSKSAGARLQIFAAGAIMNLVIAFPLAILACLAGRVEGAPVIGQPSDADFRARLRPGDRILEVDGVKIASIDDYRKRMVRLPQGTKVSVLAERDGQPTKFEVTVQASTKHASFPPSTTLPEVYPGTPAFTAGLRTHDEIVEINGKDAVRLDPEELREEFHKSAEGKVTLKVRHREGGEETVVLQVLPSREETWIPREWSLREPVIEEPAAKSPAQVAGLRVGDRIVKINGAEIKSFQDIVTAMKGRAGQEVTVEYRRDGATSTVKIEAGYGRNDQGVLGVKPAPTPIVASVPENSVFHKAGLQAGDKVLTIVGLGNATVKDFSEGRATAVELEIERNGEILKKTITPEKRIRPDYSKVGIQTLADGQLGFYGNFVNRRWTFGEAVSSGLREPVEVIDITFRILGKLFVREEDPTGLAGPVGIFKASFSHAQLGIGNFLWLLVLITVNLGIFNLLPVPVLDGGHILLLAIEKIKGSPPSPRFVERFQLVGLVLLLSLLIFVTVNDLR